jgi:hypothetical protein
MARVEQAVGLIRDQIQELDQERRRLERALKSLVDSRPGSAAKRSTTRRRPRRPAPAPVRRAGKPLRPRTNLRAKQGQRQQQFIDAVAANPGASPRELSEKIGISSNQVYALARKARESRQIVKQGKGFKVRAS